MLTARDFELQQKRIAAEETALPRSERSSTGTTFVTAIVGGITGASLGVIGGFGLASGTVPGLEALSSFGMALPLLLGCFLGGTGTVLGSFFELLPIVNKWRED